jgi:hypothetical protein
MLWETRWVEGWPMKEKRKGRVSSSTNSRKSSPVHRKTSLHEAAVSQSQGDLYIASLTPELLPFLCIRAERERLRTDCASNSRETLLLLPLLHLLSHRRY